MTVRPILKFGDKRLERRSLKINRHTNLRELEQDLRDTVDYHSGAGLAAIQIGIPVRAFVAEGRLYVNPKIVKVSQDWVCGTEGCLSIPDYVADVWRHGAVTIQAFDSHFHPFRVRLDDCSARIVQHEYDHLEGKLIVNAKHENFRKEVET